MKQFQILILTMLAMGFVSPYALAEEKPNEDAGISDHDAGISDHDAGISDHDAGILDADNEAEKEEAETVEKDIENAPNNSIVAQKEPDYFTVVVAKRTREDVFTSDRSVAVVDEKKLKEMTPRSMPEALWNSPGVFVQQTNHGGGSPILRGRVGPQNLILVDGVRLNNSVYRTGPVQYLNLIDPLSVKQIEVLRGPGSVLYGSDAMGGVIQIVPLGATISHVPKIDVGGEVSGTYSSANRGLTFHTHDELNYDNFGVLAGVSYKDFDSLTGGRGVGEQVYSGYTDLSVIGNAAYRFENPALAGWWITGTYLFSRIDDAGRTDKLVDSNSLQMYDNDDGLAYVRLHGVLQPIHTSLDLTMSFQHFFERKDSHKVGDDLISILSTTRDDVTVYTLGADAHATTGFLDNRLRLLYGGMFYRDWVDNTQKTRQAHEDWTNSTVAAFPSGSTYDNYGAFVLLEGDPVSTDTQHILRLSAGVRLHGMRGLAPARLNLPKTDVDYLGAVFLGGIQYLYKHLATVAFTFSQGFRAPNLNEAVMLGDTGKYFHIPNDDLKPEQSNAFELVSRLKFRRFTIGASGYVSLLADLIKREETTWEGQGTIDEKPVAQNVNGQKGLLFGFEGELGVDLSYGFSTCAHITYTRGNEILPDDSEIPLTRIPPLFGYANLRYDIPGNSRWKGYLETYLRFALKQNRLSVEDEKDVRIPEGGTPGWWTWNIAMGHNLWEHVHILLRAENLLNKKYKYHGSGIYGPGTNVTLTLRLSY